MSTSLPDSDTWLLAYIDGLDTVRKMPLAVLDALDSDGPRQHRAFVKACQLLKLPLHTVKTIVNSFSFKVLGGVMDGIKGTLSISTERQAKLSGEALRLLSLPKWSSNQLSRIVGNFAYAALFRRPAFSILTEVFTLVAADSPQLQPTTEAFDEILVFTILLPLFVSNLRASFRQVLSASDASTTGASICETTSLLQSPSPQPPLQPATCQHEPRSHSCSCCNATFCSRACGFVTLSAIPVR